MKKIIDILLNRNTDSHGLPSNPCIIKGGGSEFKNIISVNDIDDFISVDGARLPYIAISNTKKKYSQLTDVPFQQRELGYFDSSIILQEFLNGSSIIMKHIDRRFPAVAALKNKVIEELFPYTVQANAYLAPSDTQGVQIHADPHATLLIQCSGKKRWLVWGRAFDDTQESLLESLDLDKRVDEIAKGQPIIDEFVYEGDILYIPKGYVHTPFTSDTHSLHLTLGIQTNSESSLAYTGKSIPNDNNVSYSCKDYMLAPHSLPE